MIDGDGTWNPVHKVIDIFTGSGQTNLAAEILGRKHIGIDTQEKYIKYAAKRIANIESRLWTGEDIGNHSRT